MHQTPPGSIHPASVPLDDWSTAIFSVATVYPRIFCVIGKRKSVRLRFEADEFEPQA